MSVNSISGSAPIYLRGNTSAGQTSSKVLWAQLGQDLSAGNLSGAQSAFASLKQNYLQNHPDGPPSVAPGTPTPLRDDIQQLSQALSAGNLGGAQSAFAQLATDWKAANPSGTTQTSSTSGTTTGTLNVLA
jgi:hypothetical protein